ncbi:MAG: multiheme c-type cytochrome, partial [Desulfobacterales bacterium]
MLALTACGGEKPVDVEAITAKPQTFVGSDTCTMCHLEHYDSWKMTLHSRTLQDAQNNRDAIVVDFDPDKIKKSLGEFGDKLQVPAD